MAPIRNKQVVLAAYTSGLVSESDFKLEETVLESDGVVEGSGDVLIRNLWISVDPWNRLCMHGRDQGLFMPQFELNKPISALVVARVISSGNPRYQPGDLVAGVGTVSEYSVLATKGPYGVELRKIDPKTAPLHYHLGMLGMPAFTAWIGLILLAQIKAEDEIFVSAAMGGVGLAAGQIAKLRGCRIVGSAGSDEKVKLLKEKFGFDDAFNYKTEPDWNAALGKLFPRGIDVYLDNVGGRMLESVLNHITHHARIPISGMISQYNQDWKTSYGVRNLFNLVGRCAKIEGFITPDKMGDFPDFLKEMSAAIEEGKIVSTETITDGVESFPSAFVGIMQGKNMGKHMIRVPE